MPGQDDDATPATAPQRRERRDAARAARRRRVRRQRAALLAALLAPIALLAGWSLRASPSRPHAEPGGRREARTATPPTAAPPKAAPVALTARERAAPVAPRDVAVPILTYHVVADPPPGAPFPGLYVTAAQFADQVHVLARAGWRGVTLDEIRAHWQHGSPLPAGRPLVMTFDNGYESQFRNALPVLRAAGWVADENLQLTGLPPSQGGLTTTQVHGLVEAGWELDTQGVSHADLITLDAAQLRHQIVGARTALRREYHVGVRWFCYPSGHYDARVVAAVRRAGFVGSTTTVTGWAHRADDPYRLARIRALGGTTGRELLAEVDTARDAAPPPDGYGTP